MPSENNQLEHKWNHELSIVIFYPYEIFKLQEKINMGAAFLLPDFAIIW